jgi:uncharacterized protein (TIGR03435 family)
MSRSASSLLKYRGRILLPAAACAFAVPVLLGLVFPPQDPGPPQAAQATITLPEFAVVSVKPSNLKVKEPVAGIFKYPGGVVRARYLTLGVLLKIAFDVQPYQIVGGPAWMHDDLFDIDAQAPASSSSNRLNALSLNSPLSEGQRLMLQALLISRFQLAFHRENKTGPVYLLEKVSKRPKLHSPRKTDAVPWVGSNIGGPVNGDGIAGQNVSMPLLAIRLSRYLQCPVLDKTELNGEYDFKYVYANNNPNSEREFVDSILTSVQALGLRLRPSTAPVDTIVIDNAEKPSPN